MAHQEGQWALVALPGAGQWLEASLLSSREAKGRSPTLRPGGEEQPQDWALLPDGGLPGQPLSSNGGRKMVGLGSEPRPHRHHSGWLRQHSRGPATP